MIPMSHGEQLVWAAVFAKEFNLKNPPPHTANDREAWGQWEEGQVSSAIEIASCAVGYLRESGARIEEGFGADSDVYLRLLQVLDVRGGKEPRTP